VSRFQPTPALNRTVLLGIRLDRIVTVRAIAILLVVFYHAFSVAYGAANPNFVDVVSGASASPGFAKALWLALTSFEQLVTIFFIIAGYFAHCGFRRWQRRSTTRSNWTFIKFFLWRRFWRLIPMFWVALLFSYGVSFDHPFSGDGLRKLAVNASLFKTLVPGYFFSINHAHWYVAAQWQLDLVYPAFLYVVARRSTGLAVVMAWVISFFFAFVLPHFSSAAWWHYFPLRWWAEWSLGVYLADRHLAGFRVFRWPIWTLVASAIALVVGRIEGIHVVSWFALRIFLGCGLEAVLLSRSARMEWERRLAPITICSFSLYLIHIPVQQLVGSAMRAMGADIRLFPAWAVFAAASCVLSVGLARITTKYVEKRSSAFGNRVWRRRFLIRDQVRLRRARLFRRESFA
jgi:peptidoglycan/LPS O-acetylase OafA/YrhL